MIFINILYVIFFYWYVYIRYLCIFGINCVILFKNEFACRNFFDKFNKYICMFIIFLCLFVCLVVLLGFFGFLLYILIVLVIDN